MVINQDLTIISQKQDKMKTAEEVLLKELYGDFLKDLPDNFLTKRSLSAMKAYAKQCAEQALKDASENATFEIVETAFMEEEVRINKQSILQTEIKLP